ncbi:MAG: Zn-dependent hydrolase [Rhodothermales bacterium]|nr:Zn-dependent hydrolase [Rhodothermales bacterium]
MRIPSIAALAFLLTACSAPEGSDMTCEQILSNASTEQAMTEWNLAQGSEEAQALLAQYTPFRLTTDLSVLTENECRMLPLLMEAADAMDEIFWVQAYGDKESLMASIDDPGLRTYAEINYGPWDRIDGDAPFVDGVGDKPAGANLYPANMTRAEFEAAAADDQTLSSLYTLVRRNASESLESIPYHEAFAEQMERASGLLLRAAELAEEPGLKRYLETRAAALISGDYLESDLAWMDMKDNTIDVVIGPIETYEDGLFGSKAAAEAYVLVKDQAWSSRLARYSSLLPGLQEALPVAAEYKAEVPGSDSDLNAYDVLYYTGDSNAGSKTIAINLPNDERVQLEKGTRRLQLKNAMQAKFDKILVPISGMLIAEDQREHVTFDAFFGNTMFHEVAHGLGIKNTINGRGTVREALKEHASALEEGKADILGLFMVSELIDDGEWEADIRDHYVTFLAGIFRSVRFGASSAHGRANMIRFNYFREQGAFTRDDATGTYRADYDRMAEASNSLSELILTLQGNGDYEGVAALVEEYGVVGSQLQQDLDRLGTAGIPVDIVFEQGLGALTE